MFILYHTHIYISIKECVNRDQFFILNHRDFIVQHFETYRTQRQVVVVYGSIDLNALVEDNRNEKF